MSLFTSTAQNRHVKSLSQVHTSSIGAYPNIINNSNLLVGLTNSSAWPGCRFTKTESVQKEASINSKIISAPMPNDQKLICISSAPSDQD